MIVIFSGDRNKPHTKAVEMALKGLQLEHGERLVVVSGGAKGVDTTTRDACLELGIRFIEVPALWKTQQRAAGPKRNRFMFDYFDPDLLCWFYDDLKKSRGTLDAVKLAVAANIEIEPAPPGWIYRD